MGRLSSTGSEILAFGSHCSANFQLILDCFIPKFKLKYDSLENIKVDPVNTVVFNLLPIKQSKFFWDTRYFAHIRFHLHVKLILDFFLMSLRSNLVIIKKHAKADLPNSTKFFC